MERNRARCFDVVGVVVVNAVRTTTRQVRNRSIFQSAFYVMTTGAIKRQRRLTHKHTHTHTQEFDLALWWQQRKGMLQSLYYIYILSRCAFFSLYQKTLLVAWSTAAVLAANGAAVAS